MSEVEKFYVAICEKMQIERKWNELHPVEQHQFVDAINVMLQVVHNPEKF